jgi:hypothetical protein
MNNPFPDGIPFTEHFSTNRGRVLANRLNLKGAGSEKMANSVSGFFWNLQAAITLDGVNQMKGKTGNCYVDICMLIHKELIKFHQYNNLPEWVRGDVDKSLTFLKSRASVPAQ